MTVRKLISLSRNASNFPRAIILCPQQNKRVIFLKMRGIEIFDKSYGKCCTFDCGNCIFHKHLACLIWGWGPGGRGKGFEGEELLFFFKELNLPQESPVVDNSTLTVHIPIKRKLQGCCLEPLTSKQED